ncbi:hypothetical protein FRC18_000007 [Serendipita sp. 400]|nr:hypothetical protein FRC18_000007 [Serendipita sp. 400]
MSLAHLEWPIVATPSEPVKQESKDLWDAPTPSFDHWRYDPTAPQLYDFFPMTTSYDEDIALSQSTLHSLDPQLYQKGETVQSCSLQEISSPIRLDSSPSSSSDTISDFSCSSTIRHGDCLYEPIDQPLFPEFTLLPPSESLPAYRETIKENPEPFIFGIFPTSSQTPHRDRLRREVITSRWWLENTLEPNGILMQFVRRLNNRLFECTSCGKKLKRIDRAVDHFRVHLEHRPFRCNGHMGCGDSTCELAFYTRDCLKSHCSKHEKTCDRW